MKQNSSRSQRRIQVEICLFLSIGCAESFSWSQSKQHQYLAKNHHIQLQKTTNDVPTLLGQNAIERRKFLQSLLVATTTISATQSALAYTPDPDPLRESLYLMSRVQEATVQQERFVNRATSQDALKSKMKLTLRLVEKNYRLLDQITFASEFISPADKVVDATAAGYEAAEALQNAIDYVKEELKSGPFEKGQKEYLTDNLTECRERLFDFLSYMPQEKLEKARKRVEEGMNQFSLSQCYFTYFFRVHNPTFTLFKKMY
jgi:hypothetical protein